MTTAKKSGEPRPRLATRSKRVSPRPRLALSVGCPCGVGPEVSVRVAAAARGCELVLVGDLESLRDAAGRVGVDPRRVVGAGDAKRAGEIRVVAPFAPLQRRDRWAGRPTAVSGRAQLAWIDHACDMVTRGEADAIVTGPVSKDAIARSGARGAAKFLGHTEHLAARVGAREVVMAFCSKELTTSLVTTHLPLAKVARAIRPEGVARAIYWTARLSRDLGEARPRIAVCSLNPHAGEGGLLGEEERTAIVPGIELARARLAGDRVRADVVGPIGAETAFRHAVRGPYDAVVAMYHDQATIPMKLIGFGDAVNVSLGMPIIRTSVDHGTGYDIAGKGTADPSGMRAAIELAARLVTVRRA
ncbi:MAG: 4-hydroxythreonine-4-phosphate dehydrogenase PdxA [Myxococcales bacterium]|nr:4-hydroxythreonine-4-phosphate dehydrogenase PdxA [Myxococcales bacterium]